MVGRAGLFFLQQNRIRYIANTSTDFGDMTSETEFFLALP